MAFKILVYLLSFFLQSCTSYVEKRKYACDAKNKSKEIYKKLASASSLADNDLEAKPVDNLQEAFHKNRAICKEYAALLGEEYYSSGDEWNMYNTKEFREDPKYVAQIPSKLIEKVKAVDLQTWFEYAVEGASMLPGPQQPFVRASLSVYGLAKAADFILNDATQLLDHAVDILASEDGLDLGKVASYVSENGLSLVKDIAISRSIDFAFGKSCQLAFAKNIEKRLPDTPIKHHLVSNKHFSHFTPKYEEILNKYGKKLNEEWNIIKVPYKYHYSKHPEKYHKFVLEKLTEIDKKALGNQELFLELFNKEIKEKVLANPNMLNKTGW